MRMGALGPYEESLACRDTLQLVAADGRLLCLDIDRYLAGCDATDGTVLDRCRGPVLDVGCGPGRIVQALAERGVAALGVDIAETAVALSLERGGTALNRSVFDRVPGEGRWPTALVLDGNVGIGGDVDRLLARLTDLLAPDGRMIVEVATDATADEVLDVRFGRDGQAGPGPSFPWAVIGEQALVARAARLGLYPAECWSMTGRAFVELTRSRTTRTA